MTVAYAMADMKPSADGNVPAGSVTVSGGCGTCHEVGVNSEGRPCINCAVCGPILIAGHYGWSATPHGVPLTPDQVADRELAERDAKDHQNDILRSMTDAFVSQMGQFKASQESAPAPQRTLQEQLAEMSPEARASLFSSFGQPAGDGHQEPAHTAPKAAPRTTAAPRGPKTR